MSRLLDTAPDTIQSLEPSVGCCLVTNLSPNTLLNIQTRLIRRQVFQFQTFMSFEESPDFFSLVPTGSIDIQPNRVTSELAIEMSQTLQKSLPIAFGNTDHPLTSQQGSYPAKYIQPFAVLTGRGDSQSLSSFSPTSTCTGMQTKSRFILKNQRFPRPQTIEFFLKLFGISEHPWHGPVNTNNYPASLYTQADVANVGLGEFLSLSQADALNAQPTSAHPNELDSTQTPTATSLNLSLISFGYLLFIHYAALSQALTLMLLILARLPHASIDLNSAASNLKRRLSIPGAVLPISAIGPLSSNLAKAPGFSSHRLSDAPELPLDALKIKSNFSYINTIIASTLCKFVYDVCINRLVGFILPVSAKPIGRAGEHFGQPRS